MPQTCKRQSKLVASNGRAIIPVAWEHNHVPVVVPVLLSSHGADSEFVPKCKEMISTASISSRLVHRRRGSHKYEA
jgi:hypothetical protein